MSFASIFVSASCWVLSILSAQYALKNDSGHSGFDFSLLGLIGLCFICLAIVGIVLKKAPAIHLFIAATVLSIISFFIRYSLVVPYDLWAHDMEDMTSYRFPFSPQLFFVSVGCLGLIAHISLIMKKKQLPRP